MLKNYIKLAWRSMAARKFYTFLNLGGLMIALSACMLIYLYASYNLSFDRYHRGAEKIYRMVMELHLNKTEYDKGTSYAEYKTLKQYPQVANAAFSITGQSFVVDIYHGDHKRFKEEKNVAFANADWFNLFTYYWLAGDASALNTPGNVVLTQKIAQKCFGSADAMDKMISFNGKAFKVAGIIADAPYNTDIHSDIYVSFSSLTTLEPDYLTDKYFQDDWGDVGSAYTGFVKLKNAGDRPVVEKLLVNGSKQHLGKGYQTFVFKLLPLADIHFDTRYGGTVQKPLLWVLVIVGLLIITIAVINHINITVAQQTRRSAEIGTRKVLGGSAMQIFMQFIIESALNTGIAVMGSVILVILILPTANNWLFANEPVYVASYTLFAIFLFVLLVVITAGTGIYPALVLSKTSITKALKNNALALHGGLGRKLLVIFQNTITQALIACTIIIVLQVHYLRNTDIGFNRQSVLTMPVGQLTSSQKEQFSQALHNLACVRSFSFCNNAPASNSMRGATIDYNGRPKWESWPARFAIGDSAYCQTFGLHLLAGRNMRNHASVPEFIINQTMAKMLEAKNPDHVLGKNLSAGDIKGIIVGVVKDFNVRSLAEPIEPSILLETANLQTNIAVKLSGNKNAETITQLQKIYENILPDQVFTFRFIDEQIAQLYKKEAIQQRLIWLGAVLAVIISSLGLLGLVSIIALQRTKEIGIRKVLGASVSQISLMLSTDFLKIAGIAFMIASPIAWLIMDKWLHNFAYRIHIGWWMFALAGLMAFIIAATTIGLQAV